MKKQTSNIFLKLNSVADAYSEYSTNEHVTIKEDFHEHIMNLSDDESVKNNLKINIHLSTPASDEEKFALATAIKKHNQAKIRDIKTTNKFYILIASLLLIAGATVSLIYFLLNDKFNFIAEFFLEVGAWVFIWEFVDILAFRLPSIHFKAYLYKRIIDSKIIFIED